MKNHLLILAIFLSFPLLSQDSPQAFLPEKMGEIPDVRDFTMTSDGSNCYFTVQSAILPRSIIVGIHKVDGNWGSPYILPFSGKHSDLEPFLSSDGHRMYFASNRPKENDLDGKPDFDIWYVDKDRSEKWSEPVNLGTPVNSEGNEFYPAITDSGNIYFTLIDPSVGPADDIYVSIKSDTGYVAPVAIVGGVNTEGAEFNAYVHQDESFIIFSGWQRADGQGRGDLYISFNEGGKWSTAVNVGRDINSVGMEYCPFYHEASGKLYFTSRRGTDFDLPDQFDSFDKLMELLNNNAIKSSIYSMDFSDKVERG